MALLKWMILKSIFLKKRKSNLRRLALVWLSKSRFELFSIVEFFFQWNKMKKIVFFIFSGSIWDSTQCNQPGKDHLNQANRYWFSHFNGSGCRKASFWRFKVYFKRQGWKKTRKLLKILVSDQFILTISSSAKKQPQNKEW